MYRLLFRRIYVTVLITLSGIFVGCSSADDNRVEVIAVSGKVTSHGQPAEGVVVQLVPSEGSIAQQAGLFPGGVSDADGVYHISSYKTNDGAPQGDYKVRLYWPGPAKELSSDPVKAAIQNSGPPGRPEDRYKYKYWKRPETNPWDVVVSKESPDAGVIELPLR